MSVAPFGERLPEMVAMLNAFVTAESPSTDDAALGACASLIATVGSDLLHTDPDHLTVGNERVHLLWRAPHPRVLVLGHFDTVWPRGTISEWPFTVNDNQATGPGCFDMKGGMVQALYAVAALSPDQRDAVEILFTCDEEMGSPAGRRVVEDRAAAVESVLVFEPSANGALKVSRSGAATYRMEVQGRAAHAGLEPQNGINALHAMAQHIVALPGLARHGRGTTVTPTLARAGSAPNVVPERAEWTIDVRATEASELERVDHELREYVATATPPVTVTGGIDTPPMSASAAADLFARATRLALELGLDKPDGVAVGGVSDGNLTAALGIPTLDGLGAVGDGAHARHEWIDLPAMAERAALAHALIADLLAREPSSGDQSIAAGERP